MGQVPKFSSVWKREVGSLLSLEWEPFTATGASVKVVGWFPLRTRTTASCSVVLIFVDLLVWLRENCSCPAGIPLNWGDRVRTSKSWDDWSTSGNSVHCGRSRQGRSNIKSRALTVGVAAAPMTEFPQQAII